LHSIQDSYYGVEPTEVWPALPKGQVSFTDRCRLAQGAETLGPYIIGLQRTWREKAAAWYGVAVLFFVVLVPTTNATILAYFTADVRHLLFQSCMSATLS